MSQPAGTQESGKRSEIPVVDFRIERLRRAVRKGGMVAAMSVAEKYAASGLAEAQYLLAQTLSESEQPADVEAAKRWYEAAARQGHVEATKALWRATAINIGAGAVERSLEFIIRAADLGDYQASGVLIAAYGRKPDAPIPNMLAYLQRHVERGHSYAQVSLAGAYAEGYFGLPRNAERAFELLTLAAQGGDAYAMCCVGISYAYGKGVQQDDEQAVHWYLKAARAGSIQAQCNLGYSYEVGRRPLQLSMREANRWYRRAALRDFDVAQYNLGLSYLHGRELQQSIELENRWFARAAQLGNASAQVALGYSYEKGRGVECSYAKALELYQAAADSGDAQGQHNYAYMLENGFGTESNLHDAARWYAAATEQGLAVAQGNLASMYIEGRGVEKNPAEALRLWQSAAAQGLATAQCNLAWMYETGTGVPLDRKEALRLYGLSAKQGWASGIEGAARLLAAEQSELARAKARADLNACEARLSATDPDYPLKKDAVVAVLKPVFGTLDPSQWLAAFETAYQEFQLLDASTEQPDPDPVTPSNALSADLESTGRRGAPQVEQTVQIQDPRESYTPVKDLLEVTSSPSSAITDTQAIRDKIFEAFDVSTTSDQRGSLLAMFRATMDIAESHMAKTGDAQRLAKFREARADDYTRLLVKESCVGEDVSPEMFMAVTNREISEGRLTPDDPIRQMAVKAAAAPHPSHAELLERAETRKASDMSIESLKNELLTTKNFNIADVRKKILKEFDAAVTSDQRGTLLAIFKAVTDNVERNLAVRPDQAQLLEEFRKARDQDYKIFIVQECTVGLDTPVVGGDISVDMLMAVTNREIAAGRMTEDHSLRKLAIEGAAAPHLSHTELVTKHAKLKHDARSKGKAAPKTLGQKLKTLLWKWTIAGRAG
jgi:hypothetical protein